MNTLCTDISGEDKLIKDSIYENLGDKYHIYHKVINFMDYGVPSSRPRTIVIGTLKSLHNITPLNLFPTRKEQVSLREAIGEFPSLAFGEKSPNDIYHFARKFPEYQIAWIENLKEGESAFAQLDKSRRPYKIDKDGEKVPLKGAYMGNKYRRLSWDKPCSCVATRNDQLASQDTIHPQDNRVLSIRELMKVMTIPDSFRWSKEEPYIKVNDSERYLAMHELNIRRCIGEAVPTHIIHEIASKIKTMLNFQDFVDNFKEENISNYVGEEYENNFYINTFLQEQKINNAKETGSFYTPQCVVFDALKTVSINKDVVRILEPSVGLGAFLPQLATVFSAANQIEIDAVELNVNIIKELKRALRYLDLGCNVNINYHHNDFLKFHIQGKYDLIATNPPYGKTSEKYPQITGDTHKTKNLFALFMIKFMNNADQIACVIPKNFVIADEFRSVRKEYENFPMVRLCDFGVKFFKKVFVEIISIHFQKGYDDQLKIIDYVNDKYYSHPQGYIYHDTLWLLYRNAWFDEYIKGLQLDIFTTFRDRQITNKHLKNSGNIRVLRSKNILNDGSIVNINGYDKYIDDASAFGVGKYLNTESIIMPNFTYNTRATMLPANTIPNGSIAILIPKVKLHNLDLSIYATPAFREYYAIVKSRSRFTLNIDNCSIHYIGIKK